MTSKASTPEVEGVVYNDYTPGLDKEDNHFENTEDCHTTEEDPCLPVNNKNNLIDNNIHSNDSLPKKQIDFMESEKEGNRYFSGNNEYSPSNSPKKLKFVGKVGGESEKKGYEWSSFECENQIRKKFGLTHCGFLVGILLVCATVLFLLVIIILGVTWPRTPHSQMFPICTKSACLRSSALMLPKLNRASSPCEDFYEFACGGWAKKHSKPPPTRSRWGVEEEMDLKLSEAMREVISVLPHQTRTNSLTWKIKNFYDSCMALDNIETDNEVPLKKIITQLGGWNVLRNFQVLSWEFSKTLVKLHGEYGITPFFSISVIADPRNASNSILTLSPSGLGLPDKSYYYRGKEDRMSSSYIRYMKDVARQLGATSTDANSFAEDMFYFERRIAEATPPSEELEDLRNRKIFTINALKSLAPSVPLHDILDAMFSKVNIDEDTEVLVASGFYLSKVSNIIATTDRSALNNYVMWNLVKEYLSYLSRNFQDIHSVYLREMAGTTDLMERWEFCIKTLQRFMDYGLAAQLERSTTIIDAKRNVETVTKIFESVREVIRESVTKARWVDLELYKHLVNKINNTTLHVGFPSKFLDYSYLEEYYSKLYVQKNNFFQNILYGVSYLQEEKKRMYVDPKEEYKWLSPISSEFRVSIIPSANTIIVPQRLLNKPYYEPEYPLPVLYGTLGVQISREFVSSLLKYSGLYASNGSLVPDRSLVANLTLNSIDHQLRCLVDLLATNDVVDEERANKTSLSTFINVSAVKQSLKALKKVTEESEHIHQAGLEEYDDESLFYLAYGQGLHSVKTVQELDKENTIGTSLNGKEMLKVVRLQLKSFSEAFGCSPPINSCRHIL